MKQIPVGHFSPLKIPKDNEKYLQGVQIIDDKRSKYENILHECQKKRTLKMCTVY